MKPRLIFLVGPTASGKTNVSIALARRLNAEIVCCDSMQVYRGMDILTSKPPARARKSIPHHCVNFVPVGSEYDVSQYRRKALAAARAIVRRGRVPVFVGGTGLYMSALIDGIFEMKAGDEGVRRRLYARIERLGSPALHRRLADLDPSAALKIHPNDARRIVRALEVYEVTGKPISELQQTRRGLADEFDVRIFCLDLGRDELYRRIEERVDRMFRQGLVSEVRRLLKRRMSRTASRAIGVSEVAEYLAGRISRDGAVALMKKNTRHYARRQLTWFRKDKRIEWIAVRPGDTARQVAIKIEKRI